MYPPLSPTRSSVSGLSERRTTRKRSLVCGRGVTKRARCTPLKRWRAFQPLSFRCRIREDEETERTKRRSFTHFSSAATLAGRRPFSSRMTLGFSKCWRFSFTMPPFHLLLEAGAERYRSYSRLRSQKDSGIGHHPLFFSEYSPRRGATKTPGLKTERERQTTFRKRQAPRSRWLLSPGNCSRPGRCPRRDRSCDSLPRRCRSRIGTR